MLYSNYIIQALEQIYLRIVVPGVSSSITWTGTTETKINFEGLGINLPISECEVDFIVSALPLCHTNLAVTGPVTIQPTSQGTGIIAALEPACRYELEYYAKVTCPLSARNGPTSKSDSYTETGLYFLWYFIILNITQILLPSWLLMIALHAFIGYEVEVELVSLWRLEVT